VGDQPSEAVVKAVNKVLKSVDEKIQME